MTALYSTLQRISRNTLARNAGWMMAGQGFSLLLQAAYFVILARLLGVLEYGIFAGAFAFSSLIAQYSSLGTGTILLRYVAGNPRAFSLYWGNVLVMTLGLGSVFTLGLHFLGSHLLNPRSATLVIPAGIANCICTQLMTETGRAFQAFEKMRTTAFVNLLLNLIRTLTAGVMLMIFHHVNAYTWAVASMSISILVAVVAATIASRYLGLPKPNLKLLLERGWEGFGYSFAASTSSVYNDIDKTLLSHYGMNKANGIYTMAYRILDISTIPIIALRDAALPRLFQRGRTGLAQVVELTDKLLKKTLPASAGISLLLFACAPVVPRIVGHNFTEAVLVLRWLCLMPVFRCIHQMSGSALTCSGLQSYRTLAQISAAGLNLGLNLWLIPIYGWRGAAWSSLATDGSLGVMNWLLVFTLNSGIIRRFAKRNSAENL
ncbi:MAG: oligosaccharide flippase family protein [Acidobacterium ailaaui]|nr:oligosaccharide flippase family protein [Pseudacidobacterium ailaaui]